jgi:RHS repeat-associated protein
VSTNGVAAERNGFDAVGRRVWTWNGTTTNYFVWDGQQIIADVNATGGLVRSYIWGPELDQLLAMTTYTGGVPKTYFALTDQLRSIYALADETGAIVESYRYDAWGRVLGVYDGNNNPLTQSAVGNRFLWAGKAYSFKTGLYDNRYRIYDPITGRFLSKDPSGISGGLNEFTYCDDNPINAVDPDGLNVVSLTDTHAVWTFGHEATAVGNDRTGWTYFSYGMGDDRGGAQHLGTKDNMTVRYYKTYADLRKDNPRYDDAICYKSSEKADKAAIRKATEYFDKSYWFIGRNCGNVTTYMLRAAGVDFRNRLAPNWTRRSNAPNSEGL